MSIMARSPILNLKLPAAVTPRSKHLDMPGSPVDLVEPAALVRLLV